MTYQKRDTSSGGHHPLVDIVVTCLGPYLGACIVAFIYCLCLWTLCVHWTIVAPGLLEERPVFGLFLVAVHQFLHWGVATSLYKAVRTDPGFVEIDLCFKAEREDLEQNICSKCPCLKPERAHHCKQCGRCVHRMDHHCVFVNNCVGIGNYKFFVLLLLYTSVGGVWNAYCDYVWVNIAEQPRDEKVIVIPNAVVILVVGFILTPFALFHVYLAARNSTTLEALRSRIGVYNHGLSRNLALAFGRQWWLWWSPLHPARNTDESSSRASDPLLAQARPDLDLVLPRRGSLLTTRTVFVAGGEAMLVSRLPVRGVRSGAQAPHRAANAAVD